MRYRTMLLRNSMPFHYMRLDYTLLVSHIFGDLDQIYKVIRLGLLFMNGFCVRNAKTYINRGDLIQMVISLRYYIDYMQCRMLNYKWQLELFGGKNFYKKRVRFGGPQNFNRWGGDIPTFIEVDFFSLSIFVLTSEWEVASVELDF